MVEVHAGLCNNEIGLFVVQVNHTCLGCIEATASHAHTSTKASAATATHAHVIGVVGVEHTHYTIVVTHVHTKQTARIAVLSTLAQVNIHHRTTVHAGTDTEVEHCLLVTIIDTSNTGQVTLFVIRAYLFYNRGRQVLQCCLGITKLLTIHLNLRHGLTINLNIAVVVEFSAWHTLYQFLNNRTLRGAIGISIKDQGITLRLNLGQM